MDRRKYMINIDTVDEFCHPACVWLDGASCLLFDAELATTGRGGALLESCPQCQEMTLNMEPASEGPAD